MQVSVNDGTLSSGSVSFTVKAPLLIQTDGNMSLVQSGNSYFLNPTGGGTGPELKFGGSAIIAGQFGSSVTPIGAVLVSGGDYDIAWHDTSSGLFSVWSVDANGNYLSNLATAVAGTSATLESFETIFGQDLNGDGHIGPPPPPPPTVIQTDGTTALTEAGTNYFLNPTGGGTGPELKFGGSAIIAGQFGSSVTPIGAVLVSGGDYDIAWHDTSSGLFSVWSVDANGNYLSNLATAVAGTSATLESFETIFGQDLNGDGTHRPASTSTSDSDPDRWHDGIDGGRDQLLPQPHWRGHRTRAEVRRQRHHCWPVWQQRNTDRRRAGLGRRL